MIRCIRVHNHLRLTEALDPVELSPNDLLNVLGKQLLDHPPHLFLLFSHLTLARLDLTQLELDVVRLNADLVLLLLQLLLLFLLVLVLVLHVLILTC